MEHLHIIGEPEAARGHGTLMPKMVPSTGSGGGDRKGPGQADVLHLSETNTRADT